MVCLKILVDNFSQREGIYPVWICWDCRLRFTDAMTIESFGLFLFVGDQRVRKRASGLGFGCFRTPQDLRPPRPDHRRVLQPRRHGHRDGLHWRPSQVLPGERETWSRCPRHSFLHRVLCLIFYIESNAFKATSIKLQSQLCSSAIFIFTIPRSYTKCSLYKYYLLHVVARLFRLSCPTPFPTTLCWEGEKILFCFGWLGVSNPGHLCIYYCFVSSNLIDLLSQVLSSLADLIFVVLKFLLCYVIVSIIFICNLHLKNYAHSFKILLMHAIFATRCTCTATKARDASTSGRPTTGSRCPPSSSSTTTLTTTQKSSSGNSLSPVWVVCVSCGPGFESRIAPSILLRILVPSAALLLSCRNTFVVVSRITGSWFAFWPSVWSG